ncbi:hypothetical protein Q8F55_006657 [Vanrija albida]|uniref:F-box domain-containing protein n=1 Tax=Vanrija albida TaxID=181172 RepID=A0ABR3PXW3_9TREE
MVLALTPPPTPTKTSFLQPAATALTPFALGFLALPPELATRILLFLAPDDLGVLSRTVEPLAGVERDAYLWSVWISQTAPSRIHHALSSPLHPRPDAAELVRRGTLRGIAVINGVKAGMYWGSDTAVRLSSIHEKLSSDRRRRKLTAALHMRPDPSRLVAAGILPPAAPTAAAMIRARAHALEGARKRDTIRRALRGFGVGSRRFEDVAPTGVWKDRGERVLLALCPGIKEKQRFFEALARGL